MYGPATPLPAGTSGAKPPHVGWDMAGRNSRRPLRSVYITADNIKPGTVASIVMKQLRVVEVARLVCPGKEHAYHMLHGLLATGTVLDKYEQHMLVFQPTFVQQPGKYAPGSIVVHASKLWRGKILTDNSIALHSNENFVSLVEAIVARLSSAGNTEIVCIGAKESVAVLDAIAEARPTLLAKSLDIAVFMSARHVNRSKAKEDEDRYTIRALQIRFKLLLCDPMRANKIRAKMEMQQFY